MTDIDRLQSTAMGAAVPQGAQGPPGDASRSDARGKHANVFGQFSASGAQCAEATRRRAFVAENVV